MRDFLFSSKILGFFYRALIFLKESLTFIFFYDFDIFAEFEIKIKTSTVQPPPQNGHYEQCIIKQFPNSNAINNLMCYCCSTSCQYVIHTHQVWKCRWYLCDIKLSTGPSKRWACIDVQSAR